MRLLAYAIFIAGSTLVLRAASADVGSCTSGIAQLKGIVRSSGSNRAFGLTAPQSIEAQLGHQPTAESVMLAKKQAQIEFQEKIAHAEKAAAQGNDAECMRALGDAKLMFDAR
jgi:hypothetical protein